MKTVIYVFSLLALNLLFAVRSLVSFNSTEVHLKFICLKEGVARIFSNKV